MIFRHYLAFEEKYDFIELQNDLYYQAIDAKFLTWLQAFFIYEFFLNENSFFTY